MSNIKIVADAIFTKKVNWSDISEEDKEMSFFIFNRYFSKKYPEKAQLLNLKTIDKSTAMELWYQFFKNKPYPNWLWSKSDEKEKSIIAEKDYKLLLEKLKIKDLDLDYLIENHLDFIKEELKYYKSLQKEK
jgi:hypothetical protein